ncbi:MAG TPA: MFS transporter [Candidatus Woesebacteria bacterium]|nr:MFS transporter [Candidatus Woesebacteria bacterium]
MNKQLIILLSIVFIDLAGFGVVIPLIPKLVEDSGGGPLLVGVVIALYSLFQFLFTPVWGRLSDKFGRKPILALTLFLNVFAYGIIWLAPNLWILILGRILGGVASGNLPVVYAYIADTSESHERTKRMSLIGAFFGLGFIVGPFIGGVTSGHYGLHFPFLLTAVLSLVNAIFVMVALPESNKNLQKNIKIELINIQVVKGILAPKNMSFLIFLFFLMNASLALIIGILPLFSEQRFGWDTIQNGYYFMAIGLASFITQMFIIRILLKWWDEVRLIKIGMIIFGISTLGIGFAFNDMLLYLSGALSAVGFSLMNANVQGLISLESDHTEQGAVMGVAQSAAALARVLGPLVGGVLAELILSLPYFASGVAIFVVLIWGHKQLRYIRSKS